MPYWCFVTLLTELANCHLQKWSLVTVFVTSFLVSPSKYQLMIIRILPSIGRKHEASKNNPWRKDNLTLDCSFDVVESRDFDQYLMKVSGSGRLTLHNWQLQRKFGPHQLYSNQKSHLGNQYLFEDVSTSFILPVMYSSVPAAKSFLEPATLLLVNQPNSGSFDEPLAEQSSSLY